MATWIYVTTFAASKKQKPELPSSNEWSLIVNVLHASYNGTENCGFYVWLEFSHAT